jgi:hypothetical protein
VKIVDDFMANNVSLRLAIFRGEETRLIAFKNKGTFEGCNSLREVIAFGKLRMSQKPIARTMVRTCPSSRGTSDPSTYRYDMLKEEDTLSPTFLRCFNLANVTQCGSEQQIIMSSDIYSVYNKQDVQDGYSEIYSAQHYGRGIELIKEEIPIDFLPADKLATYTAAKVEEYGKAKTLKQLRTEEISA